MNIFTTAKVELDSWLGGSRQFRERQNLDQITQKHRQWQEEMVQDQDMSVG